MASPWLSFCLGKFPVGPSCLFPGPSLTWETPQATDTQDEKASQQCQAQQGAKDDASDGPWTQGRAWKTHTKGRQRQDQGCSYSGLNFQLILTEKIH